MRVLITGAMGNLGGFAVPELLARGVCVRSFDVPSKPNLGQARRYGTSVEFFWGDVRNAAQVERATQEVDVVVHLAGIIPPLAHERPDLAEAVNVGGTRHVYDAALAQSVPPKVLLASSFDVFGPTTHLEAAPHSFGSPGRQRQLFRAQNPGGKSASGNEFDVGCLPIG